jgi:hypothetical protein
MITRADEAVSAGYKKVQSRCKQSNHQFPKGFYRLILPNSSYLVASHQYIKEICSASEDELSFTYAVGRDLQLRYTFSEGIAMNHYHARIARNELTQHLPVLIPDIIDELNAAMGDEIPHNDGDLPISFPSSQI